MGPTAYDRTYHTRTQSLARFGKFGPSRRITIFAKSVKNLTLTLAFLLFPRSSGSCGVHKKRKEARQALYDTKAWDEAKGGDPHR